MRTTTLVTAEQLMRMPDDGFRYELVAGELRKSPANSWRHGIAASHLHWRLDEHVRKQGLGYVFIGGLGFILARDPDTVRSPDLAFVREELFRNPPPGDEYWPGPPDLAGEVVSPWDTFGELDEKVMAWLDAGGKMAWVVDPELQTVSVYRSATDIKTLTRNDELDGEDVIPGFRCRVSDFFVEL